MKDTFTCPSCQVERAVSDQTHSAHLPPGTAAAIAHRHPHWMPGQVVCRDCAKEGMVDEMQAMLEAKMGPLTELEVDVIESIRQDRLLSADADDEFEQNRGRAETFAHRIVALVGSWPFAVCILVFIASWLIVNILGRPFEPYPIIVLAVLGAVLASLAGIQGPIILMSQRYQRRRDGLRSRHDYRINLKAELEIQYLTQLTEQVLKDQWQILESLKERRSSVTQNGD